MSSSNHHHGFDLEGAPSPKTDSDYHEIISTILAAFDDLLKETSWSKISYDDPTIHLWEFSAAKGKSTAHSHSLDKLHTKKSKISLLKSEGVLNAPPERVAALINAEAEADIKKFEHDLISARTLKVIDENSRVYYRRYQTPAIMDNRDFISLGTLRKRDDGSIIRVATSINYPDVAVPSGFLRGRIIITGYLLAPHGDGQTLTTRISQVDPRGGIPKFLVNSFKTKSASFIGTLRDALNQNK